MKGRKTGGGSRKGRPNKITSDVRAAILEAFNKVGGADYLVRLSKTNRPAFAQLVGKIVPAKIEATVNVLDRMTHDELVALEAALAVLHETSRGD